MQAGPVMTTGESSDTEKATEFSSARLSGQPLLFRPASHSSSQSPLLRRLRFRRLMSRLLLFRRPQFYPVAPKHLHESDVNAVRKSG